MKGRLFIKLPYLVAPSSQKTTCLLVERPLNFIQPFVGLLEKLPMVLEKFPLTLEKFLVASQSIDDGLKFLSLDGLRLVRTLPAIEIPPLRPAAAKTGKYKCFNAG